MLNPYPELDQRVNTENFETKAASYSDLTRFSTVVWQTQICHSATTTSARSMFVTVAEGVTVVGSHFEEVQGRRRRWSQSWRYPQYFLFYWWFARSTKPGNSIDGRRETKRSRLRHIALLLLSLLLSLLPLLLHLYGIEKHIITSTGLISEQPSVHL